MRRGRKTSLEEENKMLRELIRKQATKIASEGVAAKIPIRGPTCFECGERAEHFHHVVPRAYGGKMTLPLCHIHHQAAHNAILPRADQIKRGLRMSAAKGIKSGRPITITIDKKKEVEDLFNAGVSFRKIAKQTGVAKSSVQRIVVEFRARGTAV